MGLVAKLLSETRHVELELETLDPWHDGLEVPSWSALERVVHERPVTAVLVDSETLPDASSLGRLTRFRASYPSVGLGVVCTSPIDPRQLFEIGRRVDAASIAIQGIDHLDTRLPVFVAGTLRSGTVVRVMGRLSGLLPPRESGVVRGALEWVHRRWPVDRLAEEFGLCRPFLSECLKAEGLPPLGRLHVWTRLFHASHWLMDPGRSAESVARQLEYADGAGFRRALRRYTGATPSEIIANGGLTFVLERFLTDCRLRPASASALGHVA